MKRLFIMLFSSLLLITCATAPVSAAETRVGNAFGNATVECDVNTDGRLDIRDLVRMKKYASGMPVTVNLNVTGVRGDSIANAVAVIKKQLLGVKQ